MKKLLLICALGFIGMVSRAQTLTIGNSSLCTVNYYLAAMDPACGASVSSISYTIPPGGLVNWTFGSITWGSGAPGAGWQWAWCKEWNFCGPYIYASPSCSPTPNQNVTVVGIPCTGFPYPSCMIMNTACNTCPAIKTQWFPTGGGNVTVKIW